MTSLQARIRSLTSFNKKKEAGFTPPLPLDITNKVRHTNSPSKALISETGRPIVLTFSRVGSDVISPTAKAVPRAHDADLPPPVALITPLRERDPKTRPYAVRDPSPPSSPSPPPSPSSPTSTPRPLPVSAPPRRKRVLELTGPPTSAPRRLFPPASQSLFHHFHSPLSADRSTNPPRRRHSAPFRRPALSPGAAAVAAALAAAAEEALRAVGSPPPLAREPMQGKVAPLEYALFLLIVP